MDLNKKGFIEYENKIPYKKTIKNLFVCNLFFGLPTAFFGKGSFWTSIIIIPLVITFLIWSIYLCVNIESKRKQYYLYLGCTSLFLSTIFLIASYKLASLVIQLSLITIFIILLLFFIYLWMIFFTQIRIIKKGFYKDRKIKTGTVAGFSCGLIGVLIGKIILSNTNQNTGIIVASLYCLILVTIFALGSTNILKYVYSY